MKKTIIKLSVLSIILMATSCKKGDPGVTGATGSTGPNLSGNMQGFASHYDVSGSKMLNNLGGDTIVLINNSNNAIMKTITDNTGKYMFSNIGTGNYSITTSKAGFGTLLTQDFQYVGGGTTYRNVAISEIPTTNVSGIVAVDTSFATSATNTSENYIKVRGNVAAASGGSEVIVFLSNPGSTSASNSVSNFSTYYTVAVTPGTLNFKINIPTADLYDLGFAAGNTIYFSAYMVGGNLNASSYTDLTTGKTVFTAISSTPVLTSVLVN